MLFYCRFTWYPGVNRAMVARRLIQQHELGTNHPERIKSWYTLAGGGAGFMIVEADLPHEVSADPRALYGSHVLGCPRDRRNALRGNDRADEERARHRLTALVTTEKRPAIQQNRRRASLGQLLTGPLRSVCRSAILPQCHRQQWSFPTDWVWGAATAAYQIEGAVREGGRGESIWDVFSHTAGTIANGDTGDIACDHFHRYPDDIALMRELGLGGYRFSIAWPRIFPTGSGRPNADGLDFYRRLVDELHAAGITPYATLYHWDLPQALQDRGGWANRDTARRFGDYTQTVAAALGSGVQHWFTINEPWVAAFLGHWMGQHAPGKRDFRLALQAAHTLLLAHGEAMAALRSEMSAAGQAGIVLNLAPCQPAGDTNADLEAAERIDGFANRWFLDALYRGQYPEDMVRLYGDAMPEIAPGDMELISQPTDVLGVNYYTRSVVDVRPDRDAASGSPRRPGRRRGHRDGLGGLSARTL